MYDAANRNANRNNCDSIIFTIKDTKLYITLVTSSARNNQKLSKLLSEGFERSVDWNRYKTKSKSKNMATGYRYFLESNFVGAKVSK